MTRELYDFFEEDPYPYFENEFDEQEYQRREIPFRLDYALQAHFDFFGEQETRDFVAWWFRRYGGGEESDNEEEGG